MPEPTDFRRIIAELEAAGVSIQKISLLMHRQYTQIKRIKETGRCQHHEVEMLLEIHRECVKLPPTITLRIVGCMEAIRC